MNQEVFGKMNVGIFGGSFDPPHVGHLWAVAYSLAMYDIDEVWVIPCYQHVYGKELENFGHRLIMCEKLFGSFDNVRVSQVEMYLSEKYKKPNFTADTLEFLQQQYKHSFSLIVGADIAESIEQWDGYDRIAKIAKILPVLREDKAIPELGSTNAREEIINGRLPDKILPPKVLDYIVQNKLYCECKSTHENT